MSQGKHILDAISELYPDGFDGFDDSKKVPPESYADYVDSVSSQIEKTGQEFTIHSEDEMERAARRFRRKREKQTERASARSKCLEVLDKISRRGLLSGSVTERRSKISAMLEIRYALLEGDKELARQLVEELPDDGDPATGLKAALQDLTNDLN